MFKKKIIQSEIFVDGMHCEHCANRVGDWLKKIKDIKNVNVDIDSGKVTIFSNKQIDKSLIKSAVENAGYKLR